MKYVMHFLEIIFSFGKFRFGWQQIHPVLPLWILNIEMMRKKLSKQWMESKLKYFSKNFFSFYFLDQLIILVWECPLHVNVQSVVVEVDRIVMVVVVVVIVTHVEIMIHHEIVVVILHDHRICVIGKFVNKIFLKRIFSFIWNRNNDRRRRYSRSRSPVQHNKREYRPRSRSPSPK
jgi:hypothetical protein